MFAHSNNERGTTATRHKHIGVVSMRNDKGKSASNLLITAMTEAVKLPALGPSP